MVLGIFALVCCLALYCVALPLHHAVYLRRYVAECDRLREREGARLSGAPRFTATVKPLEWPPEVRLSPSSTISLVDRFLLECRTYDLQRAASRHLDKALKCRDGLCLEAWDLSPAHRDLARHVSAVLQRGLGWPSDRFLPADPFSILAWDHSRALEDGDLEDTLCEIERSLGLELSEIFWHECLGQEYGTVIHRLLERVRESPTPRG